MADSEDYRADVAFRKKDISALVALLEGKTPSARAASSLRELNAVPAALDQKMQYHRALDYACVDEEHDPEVLKRLVLDLPDIRPDFDRWTGLSTRLSRSAVFGQVKLTFSDTGYAARCGTFPDADPRIAPDKIEETVRAIVFGLLAPALIELGAGRELSVDLEVEISPSDTISVWGYRHSIHKVDVGPVPLVTAEVRKDGVTMFSITQVQGDISRTQTGMLVNSLSRLVCTPLIKALKEPA